MGRVVAALAAVAVAVGVLVAPLPAIAGSPYHALQKSGAPEREERAITEDPAGVPVSALTGCQAPGDRGGWALRDFTSTGTNVATEQDVRPRNLRLGEPCKVGDQIRIPALIQEVEITVADEDEECSTTGGGVVVCGDPAPPVAGACTQYPTLAAAVAATAPNATCNTARDVRTYAGTKQVLATGKFESYELSNAGRTIALEMSITRKRPVGGTATATDGVPPVVVYCHRASDGRATQLAILNLWGGFVVTTPTVVDATTKETRSYTCPAGERPRVYTAYGSLDAPAYDGWGILLSFDGTAPGPCACTDEVQGYAPSYMTVGVNNPQYTDMQSFVTCRDTRNGTNFDVPWGNRHTLTSSNADAFTHAVPYVVPDTVPAEVAWEKQFEMLAVNVGDCPVLVRVTLVVCVWVDNGPAEHSCQQMPWESQLYQQHTPYDPNDPLVDMCNKQGFESPLCGEILFPPYEDPTKFDDVCGDPPGLSFTELRVFPYYMDCLFSPRGGWDRSGIIAKRWEASAGGDLVATLASVTSSLGFHESCGVVMNAPIAGQPIVVDTCAWSAWTGPSHLLIGATVWIFFGLWALGFVIKTVTGVVNKKTPTPLEDGAA